MGSLVEDLRAALHSLRHARSFAVFVVLSLALGIGASVTLFAVVDGVLLRPLPNPAPESLVAFRSEQSYPDVEDFRTQVAGLEALGAYAAWPADVLEGDEAVQIPAALVSGDLLHALSVPAAAGRLLTLSDDRKGADPVVVVTDGFARTHGGVALMGQSLSLSGRPFRVVGILPPRFQLPRSEAQILVPMQVGYPEATEARGAHFMSTVARIRGGTRLASAQAEVDAAGRRIAELHPEANRGRTFPLVSLRSRVTGSVREPLLLLFGAVSLLLLLACTNFANLLLARGTARAPELTVRAALGGDRARLIRQLLAESMVLAVAGGAVGLGLACWAVPLVLQLAPETLPRTGEVSVDGRVAAFALAVAVLTGLVFGAVPAMRSARVDLASALRTVRLGGAHPRLRRFLVVAQVALATTLLACSALLVRSLVELQRVRLGFDPRQALSLRIDLPEARYPRAPQQTPFWDRLLEGVRLMPGVESAGFVSELPLAGSNLQHDYAVAGRAPLPPGSEPSAGARVVSPGYFEAVRIPVLRGRALDARDRAGAPRTVVVNEALVRAEFAGVDPIGERIRFAREPSDAWMVVVGVVGDVKHLGLDRPQEPTLYVPYPQNSNPWHRWGELVVRSRGGSTSELIPGVREQVRALDPLLPITRVRPLSEVVERSLDIHRFEMGVFAAFALLALVLSATGVYGLVTYSVTRRVPEMGLRKALGAPARRVLALVLRESTLLVGVGLVLGLAGAVAAGHLLRGLLFGIAAGDPISLSMTGLVVLASGLLASALPAIRAARVEPGVALRAE
ncbi:MAG: ABC transporter permease [Myxococcaceae bacterium]